MEGLKFTDGEKTLGWFHEDARQAAIKNYENRRILTARRTNRNKKAMKQSYALEGTGRTLPEMNDFLPGFPLSCVFRVCFPNLEQESAPHSQTPRLWGKTGGQEPPAIMYLCCRMVKDRMNNIQREPRFLRK